MSMSDDVGNMVAGGVAAGVAAGLQYQRDAQAARSDDVARSWRQYAKQLEGQVLDRDLALATKDVELARKDSEIARKNSALEEFSGSAVETEQYKNLVLLLNDKILNLRRMLKRNAANSAVLNELLDRVVAEIEDVSDPSKFPSLDPVERQKIIETELAYFEETGKLEFKPRIPIGTRQL